MAVKHAVFLWNRMPSIKNGLSPIDIFMRTCWPQAKFRDLRVWGCPVYVLDSRISGGKKIPQWEPRSEHLMYLRTSDRRLSTVPLVLNLESGYITPQFHVTSDDWFATVVADPSKFPDFESPEWSELFGESSYFYVPTDEDDEVEIVLGPTAAELEQEARLEATDTLHRPVVPLPVTPPPTAPAAPPASPSPPPAAPSPPPTPPPILRTPPRADPPTPPMASPRSTSRVSFLDASESPSASSTASTSIAPANPSSLPVREPVQPSPKRSLVKSREKHPQADARARPPVQMPAVLLINTESGLILCQPHLKRLWLLTLLTCTPL
jgi:hypothetical protein